MLLGKSAGTDFRCGCQNHTSTEENAMNIQDNIAGNLKEIRTRKQLTLDEASRLTGVSRSMLSAIEKGDVNPTISVIWKIANGYKVKFSSLMEDKKQTYHIIRAENIQALTEGDGRYINYPEFPFDERTLFETHRIRIDRGGHLEAQPHMPGTEEYITVFSGKVCITAGEESADLSEGDSIHFLADIPHSYRNIGTKTVWLSMILYYRPL
jgi:transcriptional regulator with XRE-family HTH domain